MTANRYSRWRMVLGKASDAGLQQLAGVTQLLVCDDANLDAALGAIYDRADSGGGMPKGKRSAGLGGSAPNLARWLGDIRSYFNSDVVSIIQKDAIEKKGLKQLLFEPETLRQVTPNIEMVGTLMSLKGLIPDTAKEAAREIVQAVVDEITRRLRSALEQAIRGSLDRSRHSPLRCLPNMDWHRTIRKNLKNYDEKRRVVIPETFSFFARQHRRKEYHVIVALDQSGSMADSVVYGSVTGAIFASMPALETHVVVFDTEVVDLTEQCHDPVDMLFGVQLGGGTDINHAVSYCQQLIHTPKKTLFIFIPRKRRCSF